MKRIKAIVMDVDGTLTDGGIYMGEHGEVMKRFDVKDGYAIHNMMPKMNIIPVVITGRTSDIVMNRCGELGINCVIQGCQDKVVVLKEVIADLDIEMDEVAYIGDDINDMDCMRIVGITACPNDAAKEVRSICDFVGESSGGHGVIREFVEWISEKKL